MKMQYLLTYTHRLFDNEGMTTGFSERNQKCEKIEDVINLFRKIKNEKNELFGNSCNENIKVYKLEPVEIDTKYLESLM